MIEITSEIYRTLAARLLERIGTAEWFNGSVEFDSELFHSRLILTAIVYRRTEMLPEGIRKPVSDVVPVWWEFRTEGEDGDTVNDFSFDELKPYLIDYD